MTDYDKLAARAEQAGTRFDETSRRIKQLEARMAEVAQFSREYAARLAVYNGVRRSGTGATVNYARKMGQEIIVIEPITRSVSHGKSSPSPAYP